MSLTKDDLKQIKGVVEEVVDKKFDEFSEDVMVPALDRIIAESNRKFDRVDERFDELDNKIKRVDRLLSKMSDSLSVELDKHKKQIAKVEKHCFA